MLEHDAIEQSDANWSKLDNALHTHILYHDIEYNNQRMLFL